MKFLAMRAPSYFQPSFMNHALDPGREFYLYNLLNYFVPN